MKPCLPRNCWNSWKSGMSTKVSRKVDKNMEFTNQPSFPHLSHRRGIFPLNGGLRRDSSADHGGGRSSECFTSVPISDVFALPGQRDKNCVGRSQILSQVSQKMVNDRLKSKGMKRRKHSDYPTAVQDADCKLHRFGDGNGGLGKKKESFHIDGLKAEFHLHSSSMMVPSKSGSVESSIGNVEVEYKKIFHGFVRETLNSGSNGREFENLTLPRPHPAPTAPPSPRQSSSASPIADRPSPAPASPRRPSPTPHRPPAAPPSSPPTSPITAVLLLVSSDLSVTIRTRPATSASCWPCRLACFGISSSGGEMDGMYRDGDARVGDGDVEVVDEDARRSFRRWPVLVLEILFCSVCNHLAEPEIDGNGNGGRGVGFNWFWWREFWVVVNDCGEIFGIWDFRRMEWVRISS
ncbi:hypothetical protein RHMOL_Rhmol08G0298400 [Rhododendron molle]|uniref:Uncharacterized protein n=1 Tax=Rhododendron molle TaxID=49168 RepID=A0ACC0MTT0_RHOML|nr:hypothetical protein RHMOL_Rhmol08G0298400 [Rhododendron molle]